MLYHFKKKEGPLIFSVGGGKGGVGKSMVSANIAIQYAKAGLKVVLLDLDFGAANLHTIFGINRPKHSWGEYFAASRGDLSNYVVESGIRNLKLMIGNGFIPELVNIKYAQKIKLIYQLKSLNCDVVILDLGAGSSHNVVDFFSITDIRILVSTPEPTAIMNNYEFLHNVIFRALLRLFKNHQEALKIVKKMKIIAGFHKIKSMKHLITEVKEVDKWAAENIEGYAKILKFLLSLIRLKN